MTINEDYIDAVVTRVKPKPDNLKLLLTAGAALFATVLFTICLAGFYWNGVFHGEPSVPLNASQAHGEHSTTTESHTEKPSGSDAVSKPEGH